MWFFSIATAGSSSANRCAFFFVLRMLWFGVRAKQLISSLAVLQSCRNAGLWRTEFRYIVSLRQFILDVSLLRFLCIRVVVAVMKPLNCLLRYLLAMVLLQSENLLFSSSSSSSFFWFLRHIFLHLANSILDPPATSEAMIWYILDVSAGLIAWYICTAAQEIITYWT